MGLAQRGELVVPLGAVWAVFDVHSERYERDEQPIRGLCNASSVKEDGDAHEEKLAEALEHLGVGWDWGGMAWCGVVWRVTWCGGV